MNIEPSLQSFMEPNIKITTAAFSKRADDPLLQEVVLFTFVGMGLAKKRGRGDDAVWVKTKLLKDLETEVTEENGELQMKKSTRTILADLIEPMFAALLCLKGEEPTVEELDDNTTDSKRPLLTVIPGGKEP